MNPWIIVIAIVALIAFLIVLALCKAAGQADQKMGEMRRVEDRWQKEIPEDDFGDQSVIASSLHKDESSMPETIGTPLFEDTGGKGRKPCSKLSNSQSVWVLGPLGPIQMFVTSVGDDEATLRNEEFEAKAIRKPNYFSQSVANKLGIEKQAWCLDDIRRRSETNWYRRNGGSSMRYNRHAGGANTTWLREYSLLGEFFDITIEFFLLLAEDMFHEFDHYQDNFPLEEQVEADASQVMEMSEQIDVAAAEAADDYQAPGPPSNMDSGIDLESEDSRRYSEPVEAPHYDPPADTGGYDSGDSGGGDSGSFD